jgi:hypothetical protein
MKIFLVTEIKSSLVKKETYILIKQKQEWEDFQPKCDSFSVVPMETSYF